jgi:hypothetical protein
VAQGLAQARLKVIESLEARPDLTVILDASGSPDSRLQARFRGHDGEVMKIQLGTALGEGMLVSVAGQVDTRTGSAPVLGQYRVRGSRIAGIGKYHAELAMETPPAEFVVEDEPAPAGAARPASPDARVDPDDADYYEILQVSRNADIDTIHRIFHVLAQRYHPDNRETGNDLRFRRVVEAHGILSHVERRASYDVRLLAHDKARLKIFDSLESTQGVQAEIRKRKGILRVLYTKRLTDPQQPYMRGREFVELLGCPAEHLEFSIWFLRETKQIVRGDNNQFEITSHGVEAFEADESNYGRKQHLKLPAPAQASA